jgi:hypothetical protein
MALTKVTSGGLTDDSIVNADINSSAAVALSKLATDPSNASNLASGTVPTARLGSGTASSSVFLAGDSSWTAAGGGKVLKVTTQSNTSNGTYVNSTSELSAGPDFALDITYTSGSLIQIIMNGAFMSDAYGYTSPGVSAASQIFLYKTTGTVPAENSAPGGSDTAIGRLQYGNYDMHDLSPRNWGTHQNLSVNFFDSPTGTACKYYLATKSNAKLTCEIYATPTAPYMAMAVEYDTS